MRYLLLFILFFLFAKFIRHEFVTEEKDSELFDENEGIKKGIIYGQGIEEADYELMEESR